MSGFHRLAVAIDDVIRLSFSIFQSFVTISAIFNVNILHTFVTNQQLASTFVEL